MALVTQALRNAFVNGGAFFGIAIRALGFYHYQRNTIYKANNVGPATFDSTRAGNGELFGKYKTVISRILPIN